MKNTLFITLLLCSIFFSFAQNDETTKKIENLWKKGGKVTVMFNQSSFSNWVAGGENSMATNVFINYDFNYRKDD